MKKNILIIKAAISACLLLYLFSVVDVSAMGETLANATISYIVLTLLVMLLNVLLSCYKWQALLKIDKVKSSLSELVNYYLIGIYFNNFLPTSIGGDAVRVYLLSMRKGYAAAFTSVSVERISGLIALILFGLVGLIFVPDVGSENEVKIIFICLTIILIALVFMLNSEAQRFVKKVRLFGLERHIDRFFSGISLYLKDHKTVTIVIWTSLLYQMLIILIYFLAATSLSIKVSILELTTVVPIVTLLTMLPFSLNGLGIREGGFVFFLSRLDISEHNALLLSLLTYGLTLLFSFFGGLLFFRSKYC